MNIYHINIMKVNFVQKKMKNQHSISDANYCKKALLSNLKSLILYEKSCIENFHTKTYWANLVLPFGQELSEMKGSFFYRRKSFLINMKTIQNLFSIFFHFIHRLTRNFYFFRQYDIRSIYQFVLLNSSRYKI